MNLPLTLRIWEYLLLSFWQLIHLAHRARGAVAACLALSIAGGTRTVDVHVRRVRLRLALRQRSS